MPAAKRICRPADDLHGDCLGRVPAFDQAACGDPQNPQKAQPWGTKGRKKLPPDYWSRKRDGAPSIDAVLEFLKLRKDVHGVPVADKLGLPQRHDHGWWCLPFKSTRSWPQDANIERAWHGTRFSCLYSILYYGELFESTMPGHIKQMRAGVYCHGPKTSAKAENYMVFEDVFSIGAWWGVKLELLVDRNRGARADDQWVQPADSISLLAVWLCGLDHEHMRNQLWFVPTPWDPKAEVNPWEICDNGVSPLQAKREQEARAKHDIVRALAQTLPCPVAPTQQQLLRMAENKIANEKKRQRALCPQPEEDVVVEEQPRQAHVVDDDAMAPAVLARPSPETGSSPMGLRLGARRMDEEEECQIGEATATIITITAV